ncbi:40S ribosomal protein S30, putative [Eimeria maxima]|uniref:40S ribosomal protein S30, putative n=1 Tax=Eimeria maxima TaxID=5804 RepID=U6M873_EIMMA|nr:40S ribosomal protein S30, putative [Eimeria maxima]CDJ60226.1 40S ribosomal protein S30, putative [Eimeria maxima]
MTGLPPPPPYTTGSNASNEVDVDSGAASSPWARGLLCRFGMLLTSAGGSTTFNFFPVFVFGFFRQPANQYYLDSELSKMGKVHGSLARAGKVKNQTPKVQKQEKRKPVTGRAKKRQLYNRRFTTTLNRRRGPNAQSP